MSTTNGYKVIGTRPIRHDGVDKVTGRAIYGADILSGRARARDLKVGIVSPPDIAISFLKSREIGMRVPFGFFESASFIYDYDGRAVRTIASRIGAEN